MSVIAFGTAECNDLCRLVFGKMRDRKTLAFSLAKYTEI